MDEAEDIRLARRRQYAEWSSPQGEPVSRRRFLQLMGASLALAGSACVAPPREKIVPYVRQPEQVVPGKPLYFASAMTLGGYATGLLVESHLGRPSKIEGNPGHPASLGATDAYAQASILTLYDPDRARTYTRQGQIRTWQELLRELRSALGGQAASQGAGLRFLTESVGSPTQVDLLQRILTAFPRARWHQYEPLADGNARLGAQLALGRDVGLRYRLDQAEVVLALDADFLLTSPSGVRYARDLAARRRPTAGGRPLSRLYVAESAMTSTGAFADQRLPLRADQIEPLARALAAALGVEAGPGQVAAPADPAGAWLAALAADLQAHRGASLVIVGDGQPPFVHALGHALNQALGNVGRTLEYSDPVVGGDLDQTASLRTLVDDMAAGRVDILTILGGNPVYSAPADLAFAEQLGRVGLRIRLGLFQDETSALCHWHAPEAHYLESWGDARAYDGSVALVQPLVAPLYNGRSALELLAAFTDQPEQSGHDLVKGFWQRTRGGADFEAFWRRSLHDGLVADTALPPIPVAVRPGWSAGATPRSAGPGLELTIRQDPAVYDGRFANNSWLQELPRPISRLTWDNVATLSPATAGRLGLASGDTVELRLDGRTVRAPVWVQPGQPDESVAVTLGYGRSRGAGAGQGAGFNAYLLRTTSAPWFAAGLTVARTGERWTLAGTQGHRQMEGRDLARTTTVGELATGRAGGEAGGGEAAGSLYPPYRNDGYAWGMAIDLSTCVGCNACVVACQAENNIPVVGKAEVVREREMHWLRIDTYQTGPDDRPGFVFQPVPCMQCENAPCELVCPVDATVHSDEGLNDMVYNRCVGTRYCSNNCPYKVRRFNFFQWADWDTESLKPLRNPDVTVRSRGVMEKCTYCVQRITHARIEAEKEGRPIRDGEVVTACQAACPTDAIVFGNQNDPDSRVARLKADQRNYSLLGELNTRPRTTYLAAVRNPNPDLGTA